ncbi:hypothetical protein cypCar_00007780, partial [Cyprinus carpio]
LLLENRVQLKMEEKLSDEKLKCMLAPWRFSLRAPGFEDRLVTALQLFEHFPLDIAVTGGTPEANAQLASAICGRGEEIEEEEWETDDEGDEEEETDEEEEAEDWEEDESADEEHSIKSKYLNTNLQSSSRRKRVRIAEHAEYIESSIPDFDSDYKCSCVDCAGPSNLKFHYLPDRPAV